ncbi:IclR family transcriptional regulator [Aureimonas sp. AU12]|uniref:IclR family transcriptional regulator n=1 Tax=Aureimonas sp. AU12 TaxID=1638161 RepID=UPI001FCDD644|nr:IclR family transcriptional regulator [Aureimonas sp. AU12]
MTTLAGLGASLGNALPGASGAQAVERAFRLLSLVGGSGERGLALSEAVAASGLNKPTARRLLVALISARMVEQDETTRRYHLGSELYVLGQIASRRHGLLEIAGESLRRLAAASADTAFLSMRRDDFAVCLHREEGGYPIRTHALQAGDQHPLGVGAGSLAMLAALTDAEVEAVLARIAPVLAARYPGYTPEIVARDVSLTREAGHAFNPGRVLANSWGIGCALRFPGGRLAGALSLAAIDGRMGEDRRRDLAALLAREAAEIETRLDRLFRAEAGAPQGDADAAPAPIRPKRPKT